MSDNIDNPQNQEVALQSEQASPSAPEELPQPIPQDLPEPPEDPLQAPVEVSQSQQEAFQASDEVSDSPPDLPPPPPPEEESTQSQEDVSGSQEANKVEEVKGNQETPVVQEEVQQTPVEEFTEAPQEDSHSTKETVSNPSGGSDTPVENPNTAEDNFAPLKSSVTTEENSTPSLEETRAEIPETSPEVDETSIKEPALPKEAPKTQQKEFPSQKEALQEDTLPVDHIEIQIPVVAASDELEAYENQQLATEEHPDAPQTFPYKGQPVTTPWGRATMDQRAKENGDSEVKQPLNPDEPIVDPMDPMPPHTASENVQIEMHPLEEDPTIVTFKRALESRKKMNGAQGGFERLEREENKLIKEREMDEFESDDDDRDYDKEYEESNIISKLVLTIQRQVKLIYQMLHVATKGKLISISFLVAYIVYFIFAMIHETDDEGAHRLIYITIAVVLIKLYDPVKKAIVGAIKKGFEGVTNGEESPKLEKVKRWAKFAFQWFLNLALLAGMIYALIDEGKKDIKNLRSIPGLLCFLLIGLLFSQRASKINWHTIFWSVGLQFLCAVFALKWTRGKEAIVWVQERFNEFFANSEQGAVMLFGESYKDHLMIFGALPLVFFTNAVVTVLYYVGAMQYIIGFIGNTLKFFLRTTPLESMSISAGIFMEGFANLLLMRPFLDTMSKSELFAVLVGCMSSLGGAYLAILATLGISLEFLIPAMLVSAPATFAICKLIVPETRSEDAEDADCIDLCAEEKKKYANVMDAAQTGAMSMMSVVGNVAVIGYAFFSTISWVNHTLTWFGDRVGVDNLTIEYISSYALYPVALAMGVDPEDCRRVAMLLGYRIGLMNIVAFLKLTEMKINKFKWFQYMQATNFTGPVTKGRDDFHLDLWNVTLTNGFIDERSEAIATYSLCGFSSMLSAIMMIGVIISLAPGRKKWLGKVALPAIVAGNLANCMTGCFASLYY